MRFSPATTVSAVENYGDFCRHQQGDAKQSPCILAHLVEIKRHAHAFLQKNATFSVFSKGVGWVT